MFALRSCINGLAVQVVCVFCDHSQIFPFTCLTFAVNKHLIFNCMWLKIAFVSMLPVVNSDASFLRVVEFATKEDMKAALKKLDDTELNGKRIRLKIVSPQFKSTSNAFKWILSNSHWTKLKLFCFCYNQILFIKMMACRSMYMMRYLQLLNNEKGRKAWK